MPRSHFRPGPFHENRSGLVAPVPRDPSGQAGPTPGQAAGPRWRRVSKGLYLPADVDGSDPHQRIVEAGAALPSYGGVTGWAALCWLGSRWFEGRDPRTREPRPVTLATGGKNVRSQPGFVVSEERLDPRDLEEVDGLRITSAVRSVFFEMRYAPGLREAVRVLAMAAYSDHVSVAELTDYSAAHSGWTGVPRAREALALVEENLWSPAECDMYLVWLLDAELPRPLCNVPIFDLDGRHLATPDLLDPVAGVVGEYDGALHLAGHRRHHDVRRQELYRSLDLEPFTMVAADLADRDGMAARMLAAHARARWVPESRRRWTAVPPRWWISTVTVEQRRALEEAQRRRFLAYRTA